jgi:phenylacetic acid degradation protein
VSDEMMHWKTQGTQLYQQLPKQMLDSCKACEPLRKIPEQYKCKTLLTKHGMNQSKVCIKI